MAGEARFQTKVIRWLRDQGAYVIKTRAAPGVPIGCPDVVAFYRSKWCVVECKANEKSIVRPMQVATLSHLREMNRYVYRAHPQNWAKIQESLRLEFFQPPRR